MSSLKPNLTSIHALTALVFAAGAVAFAQPPSPSQAAPPASPSRDAAYGKHSMAFEPNRGQAAAPIRFLSHGSNYSVMIQPAQATLVVHHEQGTDAQRRKALMAGKSIPTTQQVIRMQLAGAKPNAPVAGERALPGYVNYIAGPDRSKDQTGVPTFAAARVQGAYPGVDLLYYGTDRQLEYDFVVAPNADAAQIKLHFTGAQPVLAADGALHLQSAAKPRSSDISFLKPVVYQQREGRREPIEGSFAVAKNGEVSFHLGLYDHTRELVIDPIISYASYFGGTSAGGTNGEDEINSTILNAANQLYAVGQSHSLDLPGTTGEFQSTNIATAANNNFHGGFVTKFSADGSSVLWTTYLSGAGDTFATGVAVNSADQPYIVGYTQACGSGGTSYQTAGEFPFTANAAQSLCNPQLIGFNSNETNGGNYDAFLVKLSSDGKTELYGTPLGGSANDIADSVVLDAAGKVYIVGETISTQYLQPGVNSRSSPIPNYPGAPGTANYPTTSNAFYTNTTESKLNATVQGNGDIQGPQDEQAFLTVFSADLSTILYSSLIGGPVLGGAGNGTSATNGIAVAVNANGIAYIGGNTSSAHWPVTLNAFATTCANAGAANSTCNLTGWLAAFDPTKTGVASLLFSTYMNGQSAGTNGSGSVLYPASDVFGLTVDSTGNVIAVGDTNANNYPTTSGTVQPACFTSGDGNGDSNVCVGAFLTKLTQTGTTVWSTYFGPTKAKSGGDFVNGLGVATDVNNNVFMLGSSSNGNLILKNAIVSNPGQQDAFLIELNSTASTVLMGTYLGSGGGISINSNSLHLDSNLNAYFGGAQAPNTYGGTYLPTTPNAFSRSLLGNADGFVIKMITQQQPSSTTLTASPSGTVAPTQSVTLTANVVSTSTLTGIPTTPTGTVSFVNGSTVLGTGTVTAGVATYSGTLPAGTDSLTAVYAGDSGFNGSTSAVTTINVSTAVATATTLTVSPATAAFGQTVTLTSTTVAGTTPVTAGTVTFTAGGITLATATVTPAVGTYSVVANFTGTASGTNPTGTSSSASGGSSLVVGKATPTVSVSASTALAPVNGSVTFTAKVASTTGTPTGTVNFLNGTIVLGSGTLNAGVATFTSTTLPAGTYSVSAAYLGDTSFVAASSTASAPLVVRAPAATTTTLTASALTAPIKTSITLTATIATTATGTPSGTVTFYAGTTVLGMSTLTNNSATYTTSALAAGAQTLTAVYSGDTLFLTSTSMALTETITNPMLFVTATPNPLIIQRGHSGVLTLTLTPTGGFAGTVSFGCGSLPQYITCIFAPPTLTFTAASSAAQTDTLTIYTNPQQTASLSPQQTSFFTRTNAGSLAMLLWLPGSALALLGLRRKHPRTFHKQFKSLLMLVLLVSSLGTVAALSGCGGNTSFNTAAPGTYTVPLTITGTDGSVENINASITVQ